MSTFDEAMPSRISCVIDSKRQTKTGLTAPANFDG